MNQVSLIYAGQVLKYSVLRKLFYSIILFFCIVGNLLVLLPYGMVKLTQYGFSEFFWFFLICILGLIEIYFIRKFFRIWLTKITFLEDGFVFRKYSKTQKVRFTEIIGFHYKKIFFFTPYIEIQYKPHHGFSKNIEVIKIDQNFQYFEDLKQLFSQNFTNLEKYKTPLKVSSLTESLKESYRNYSILNAISLMLGISTILYENDVFILLFQLMFFVYLFFIFRHKNLNEKDGLRHTGIQLFGIFVLMFFAFVIQQESRVIEHYDFKQIMIYSGVFTLILLPFFIKKFGLFTKQMGLGSSLCVMPLILVLLLVYGFSFLSTLNRIGDHQIIREAPYTVFQKSHKESHRRASGAKYYLYLNGIQSSDYQVKRVSWSTYENSKIGDTHIVKVRAGNLGIRWTKDD